MLLLTVLLPSVQRPERDNGPGNRQSLPSVGCTVLPSSPANIRIFCLKAQGLSKRTLTKKTSCWQAASMTCEKILQAKGHYFVVPQMHRSKFVSKGPILHVLFKNTCFPALCLCKAEWGHQGSGRILICKNLEPQSM